VNNVFRGFGAVFYKRPCTASRRGHLVFFRSHPLLQMFLLGSVSSWNERVRRDQAPAVNAIGRDRTVDVSDGSLVVDTEAEKEHLQQGMVSEKKNKVPASRRTCRASL